MNVVDSNKILTVSYGTFSCTLEGFDDAFETMKAIAEYFRDLAADDRFFGAEPPTPDAEMLARIAERGSARRVEARASDDGIVLRSGQTAAAPALAAATAPAAAVAEPAEETTDTAEEMIETPEADEVAAVETVEEETYVEVPETGIEDEDSLVAKLRRIRSVVSRTAAVAAVSEYAEDQEAFEGAAGESADVAAFYEAGDEAEAEEAVFEDELGDEDEAEAEAFAAFDPAGEDETEAWDEASEELSDEEVFENADTGFEDELEEASTEQETYEDDEGYEDEEAFEDEEAYAEDEAYEDEAYEEDEPAEDAPRAVPAAAVAAVATAAAWPRVVKVKRRDYEAALEQEAAPASALSAAEEAELQDELAALEAEIEAEAMEEPADEAYEEDLDETGAAYEGEFLADDELSEEEYAEEDDGEVAIDDDDILAEAEEDDEDEEWERALSDAEDDVAEDATEEDDFFAEEDEDTAETPVAAAPVPAAPAGRAKFDASASDGDMDRILAETNNQLHETEGTRRRSAIQHLRAAVAATKAEQQAGSDLGGGHAEDSTNPYREDLAQVVRPRRPRATGTPTRRLEDKPAPLRLVAEQRVDIQAEHREPVRPRRVSIADLIRQEVEEEDDMAPAAAASKGEGFPAFLEECGAEDLSEVLEAAASYLAFVEGREQFSRPQLMSRVREVDPEGYSREDALRAFGSLLREGKIRKVKGGRFAASDRIGFRPDQRAVG